MKVKTLFTILALLFSVFTFNIAMADENITGTWRGKLAPGPDVEMTIEFTISREANGGYSGLINSPDGIGIENIKADSITYDSGRLEMSFEELSGSYSGLSKDGQFVGEWEQEGTSFPLNLKLHEDIKLSRDVIDKLVGEWHGDLPTLTGPMGPYLSVRFEMSDQEELAGFLDRTRIGDSLPLSDIEMSDDGTFSFRIPNRKAAFKGKLGEDKILGGYQPQPGMSFYPQILIKGKYIEKKRVNTFTKEAMGILIGKWNGTVGASEISFRFEGSSLGGDIMGFIAIPDQGVEEMPFTGSNYKDGDLTLESEFLGAQFNGQLSKNKLEGEWVQDGKSNSISLEKE